MAGMIQILRPLFIASLALTVTAQADFRRDYSSGVRDFDRGNYERAIEGLKRAIDEEPTSRDDVRFYGMSFAPYLPYFFLGQSYFHEGLKRNEVKKYCGEAMPYWRKSLDEGIVKRSMKEYEELQSNQARCEQEGLPPVALQRTVEEYFKGNFREAAEVLPGEMVEDRARIQALLFRAASNFNLFLLSGEKDEKLLQLSELDIREIKKLDAGFSPFEEAFPRRFMDEYAKH